MDSLDFDSERKMPRLEFFREIEGITQEDKILLEKLKQLDGCEIMLFTDFIQLDKIDNEGNSKSVLSSYLHPVATDANSFIPFLQVANFISGINDKKEKLPIEVMTFKNLNDKRIITFGGLGDNSCQAFFYITSE